MDAPNLLWQHECLIVYNLLTGFTRFSLMKELDWAFSETKTTKITKLEKLGTKNVVVLVPENALSSSWISKNLVKLVNKFYTSLHSCCHNKFGAAPSLEKLYGFSRLTSSRVNQKILALIKETKEEVAWGQKKDKEIRCHQKRRKTKLGQSLRFTFGLKGL